jgi:hypothetical protein
MAGPAAHVGYTAARIIDVCGDVADPAMEFLAPETWWYGWVASAALGAFLIGLVATLLPDRWWRGFWLGWVWVTPLIAMIACVYLTIPWFRQ